jgi:hypothetical protein
MALTKVQKDQACRTQKGLAKAVSPSDSVDVSDVDFKVYVGTGGHLKVVTQNGTTVTLKNIQDGTYIDWLKIKRIYSKGTTATDIVAIF